MEKKPETEMERRREKEDKCLSQRPDNLRHKLIIITTISRRKEYEYEQIMISCF